MERRHPLSAALSVPWCQVSRGAIRVSQGFEAALTEGASVGALVATFVQRVVLEEAVDPRTFVASPEDAIVWAVGDVVMAHRVVDSAPVQARLIRPLEIGHVVNAVS